MLAKSPRQTNPPVCYYHLVGPHMFRGTSMKNPEDGGDSHQTTKLQALPCSSCPSRDLAAMIPSSARCRCVSCASPPKDVAGTSHAACHTHHGGSHVWHASGCRILRLPIASGWDGKTSGKTWCCFGCQKNCMLFVLFEYVLPEKMYVDVCCSLFLNMFDVGVSQL